MRAMNNTSRSFLVGRDEELRTLDEAFRSGRPEFVAVYGRRRIGKTHLVRKAFGNRFAFEHAGLSNVGMAGQLAEFARSLKRSFGRPVDTPKSWFDAFELLRDALTRRRGRKVLFLDELPWMDTPKSSFLPALEHFWNGWASGRDDILLVVCGSAASWIVDKLVDSYGGLHDRLTHSIRLLPLTLRECAEFVRAKGLALREPQILEAYLVFGGVPYYWDRLRRGESVARAVDRLCFAENGELRGEFDRLYASLFRHPEPYLAIVRALGANRAGRTKEDLVADTGLPDNGRLTAALKALENCGFIRRYGFPGKKVRDSLWQLVDPFTLFHLRFLDGPGPVLAGDWLSGVGSPARIAWQGLAFEQACLLHVPQIKRALGVSGVSTAVYACRIPPGPGGQPGAQIDLVLDRADGIVDLCEMKHTREAFAVTPDVRENLLDKAAAYRRAFTTSKAVHIVLVASGGVRADETDDAVQSVVTLDDLFRDA